MNWSILQDMLTSDFWELGGTSSFFATPTAAKEWAEEYVITPYGGLAADKKQDLLEYSEQAYQDAMWARGVGYFSLDDAEFEQYGYTVSDTEAAHIYWSKMTTYIKEELNDAWLEAFFSGQVDLNEETIEYLEEGVGS